MNAALRDLGPGNVAGFFLVLARVSPLFVLAPLFSSKSIPARAKGVVAIALTIGIAPLAMAGQAVPLETLAYGELLAKELLVGLGFAFVIGALFHAVATAGAFLDTMVGFSIGATIDPLTGNYGSVLMQLYAMVGVMVFIVIGGDAWVVRGLARTYDLVPLLAFPSLAVLTDGVVGAFAAVFRSALELCAPVLLAVIVTDAAFGVVSRVVPQMNVFAVGFPAKILVGLLVLGVSMPFAAGWLAGELERSVAEALRTLKVVG